MSGSEKLVLTVAWGPRRETAAECAGRWFDTRERLAAVDSGLLGAWSHNGTALGAADALVSIVENGAHVWNESGDVIPEMGFLFSAAAGPVLFSACAGLYTDNPNLMNRVHVEFPPQQPSPGRHIAEPVLLALVAAWEPDHGEACWGWPPRAQPNGPREPGAGFLTYLSPGRCWAVSEKIPGAVRQLPDGGVLVTATGPDGSPPSPADVEATGAALQAAGAFTPIPTDRPRT